MVLVLTFLLAKDQLENIIINHEKYYMCGWWVLLRFDFA
jgi:hypothetical protein